MYLVTLLTSDSLSLADCYFVERESIYIGTDIEIKLVTSCGCVSAFQDTVSKLVSCIYFFYNPYNYVPF